MSTGSFRRELCGFLLIVAGLFGNATAQEPTAEQSRLLQQADRLEEEAAQQLQARNAAAALKAIQQSHALRLKVWGEGHPQIVDSYRSVAVVHARSGKYPEAEQALGEALKIRRQTLGEDHLDTISLQFDHAITLEETGRYDQSQAEFEKVLEVRRKQLGNQHEATIAAVRRVGRIQFKRQNYAGAQKYFEELLAWEQKKYGDHEKTAESHDAIGQVMDQLSNYPGAASHYREAVRIQRTVKGAEDPGVAAYLGKLGVAQQRSGSYADARQNLEEALRIARKAYGGKRELIATLQGSLGHLLLVQKDFAAARTQFEQCLEATLALFGETHLRTRDAYRGLASLYQEQGNNPAYVAYTEKAGVIERQLNVPTSNLVGMGDESLGTIFHVQRNYAESLKCLNQALKLRQEAYGDDHPIMARTWNLIGTVHVDAKNYLQAHLAFTRALRIDEKTYGPEHPAVATVVNNIATVAGLLGNDDAARWGFKRGIGIFEKRFGVDHPVTLEALTHLRNLEYTRGNFPVAAQLMDRMRRGTFRHMQRSLPNMTDKEQLMYLNQQDRPRLNVALTFGIQQRKNPEIVRMSTEWLLNGKALSDTALAERALLIRDAKDASLASLLPRLQEVRKELGSLAMSEIVPGLEKDREDRLEKLTTEEAELSRRFIEARGETDAGHRPWCEAAEVQKAIPPDSVLIDVIRFQAMEFGQSREN